MVRTFIASFALALAVSGAAVPAYAEAAPEPVSFTHEGVNYTYTVKHISGGRRVIEGTADGERFRLVASKRRVEGTIENRPVAFGLNEVRPLTARERLATR